MGKDMNDAQALIVNSSPLFCIDCQFRREHAAGLAAYGAVLLTPTPVDECWPVVLPTGKPATTPTSGYRKVTSLRQPSQYSGSDRNRGIQDADLGNR